MKKKNVLDGFLFSLIDNYLDKVALGLLVLFAIVIRLCLMSETSLSPDYESYYLQWVNSYREYGFFEGLGKSIGDYYVPYNIMYAICALLPCEPYIPLTIFSAVAEGVSAIYIAKILKLLLAENGISGNKELSVIAYTAVGTLFLPFVVLNGSLWKQCDAIYVVFLVISIYKLLKEEYRVAFVFLAVAFGLKLQAVFFVPLFLVVYMIKKGFSILEFLWIPVMYVILGLPSVICKKGIRATYLAYLSQTQEVSTEGYGMVSYYPNFYNFGLDDFDEFMTLPGIVFTAALLVVLAVFAYKKKEVFDKKENLLFIGLMMAWTCCMFLPGMHERYDYAIVLIFTAFSVAVRRDLLPVALLMNICSALVYIIVLFRQYDISMLWVSALEIAAYMYAAYYFIRKVEGKRE